MDSVGEHRRVLPVDIRVLNFNEKHTVVLPLIIYYSNLSGEHTPVLPYAILAKCDIDEK
jgi:hypothetical protein